MLSPSSANGRGRTCQPMLRAGPSRAKPSQPPMAAIASSRQRLVRPLVLGLQEDRRQGRAQSQGIERRDDRRRSNRERELAKELPGDPGDEGARDKHGRQYQSNRDHRRRNLVHGPDRGGARPHPLFDVMLDRFDDDDRVVDHDPDRQHQAEQGQVIDAEAHRQHDGERTDDRHRHGDQGNHRRPPVLQEQEARRWRPGSPRRAVC